MEGYGPYADAGNSDGAALTEPSPTANGPAHDASDRPGSAGEPDGETREPIGDSSITEVTDGGATRADSGNDGSSDASARASDGGRDMDGASAADAHLDASDSAAPDGDASDANHDGASGDAASASCSGATLCVPQCNTSPCALDCANAGTCNVTCQAGQTCNIDCGSAGTCNVTCQAGARCNTLCNNIQFCSVDCQLDANCQNRCTTGGQCNFAPPCSRGYKECGPIAACGDDASC